METILITGATVLLQKNFMNNKDKKLKIILLDKVKPKFYKNEY